MCGCGWSCSLTSAHCCSSCFVAFGVLSHLASPSSIAMFHFCVRYAAFFCCSATLFGRVGRGLCVCHPGVRDGSSTFGIIILNTGSVELCPGTGFGKLDWKCS